MRGKRTQNSCLFFLNGILHFFNLNIYTHTVDRGEPSFTGEC